MPIGNWKKVLQPPKYRNYEPAYQIKKYDKGDIVKSKSGPTAGKTGRIIEIGPSGYEVVFEGFTSWTLMKDSELLKVEYACFEHRQEDFLYSKENGLVCPFCNYDE